MAVILAVAAGGSLYHVSSKSSEALERVYSIKPAALVIPTDEASVAMGKHLVETLGCGQCHADDMGGKVFMDDPMMGKVVPSNITGGKGSRTGGFTDAQWILAIRHGVGPDGKPLKFMPCQVFYHINDTDLAAMIAYYKTIPKVDRVLPPTTFGPLAMALYVMGQLPLYATAELIPHSAPRAAEVPPGPTKEYGKYLSLTGGCDDCHGAGYSGGHVPGTPPNDPAFPPATNITPTGIGKWSEADFVVSMRDGNRPDGSGIHPFMPWEYTANYTDDELRALWLFLQSVPPKETGNM